MSWQIIPENLGELISTPGGLQCMMKQHKIVIAELEAAR
jgi:predicted 3-demethylubiquinone-9 3-methyltransferase (glyoxalase superfamily)